ncbi:N-acetylglucosamine-6-phosphate deacetylase [Paenibacillus cremeus]|uniref:N-acetylglucosamine-6-phosphate deacetylase n=1 Tax=Paenibacillus cremeus TaxID=2163881 RepID=A0A559KED9_9BACL|nr:N-acetylglucosamine-6-phosphate deacetylase [Paenibacillus cremeus]TVY10496.1 N-acetylglucosamine-6-phosphate deacetylase [Paenibacillus cremeus]
MNTAAELIIVNAKVVTLDSTIESGFVKVSGGRIQSVGSMDSLSEADRSSAAELLDAKGSWLLPGFIDVHVHGGYGHDFMDGTQKSLEGITHFHSQNGTTTMLATTVTASREAIDRVLESVDAFTRREGGMPHAKLAGVHLEGPFISPKWPGAQNPSFIVPPQSQWMREWIAQYPDLVKMMTLAPETDGALELIRLLSEQGIVAACGHTDSTYAQIVEAVQHGLSHAVHTFNAMKGLHHREPGVVGAVLTQKSISAEIIADGHHVHPACIGLLLQLKAPDQLLLITDAMSAAGLGDGDYSLGGLDVVVKDGVARLKDGSSLAGSTLTMVDALRYVVRHTGTSVELASRLASLNPARLLGLEETTGSITAGKMADLLLISPELELQRVWVEGRLIR